MWKWSLRIPWHKVLNAVVAELGIHKLNDYFKVDASILCYSEFRA